MSRSGPVSEKDEVVVDQQSQAKTDDQGKDQLHLTADLHLTRLKIRWFPDLF